MPVIRCKEKEGQADACKRDIVYLGENVESLLGGGESAVSKKEKPADGGGSPTLKERYLTLKCVDGHIHNYKIGK